MILKINPTNYLKGHVRLPGSKSYSIRAFMIAACGGRSVIVNPSDCDDAKVALTVARLLGAKVTRQKNNRWKIHAKDHRVRLSKVNVKESGTVLRFILPLVSLLGKRAVITGEGSLRGRPNMFLTRTLRKMGVVIRGSGNKESIPIRLTEGHLKGGTIVIDGNLSSQFISALLITCPQLDERSFLKIKGKQVVSNDYITMTLQVLKKSGITIRTKRNRQFVIKAQQTFRGLKDFDVPSDYGLAAFLMAAGILVESNITLYGNLRRDLIQADGHILNLLRKMGATFRTTSKYIKVKGPSQLKGGSFSLKDCPDLIPIMAVLALFAKGKTRLYNIKHARSKESNRISDLRKELLKVGAKIKEGADELVIEPQSDYKGNCLLNPHNDHRLAMAFAVLGLKVGFRIKDIECTSKSYPAFVRDFRALGARATRQ